ncbi:hypothetical protein PHYPO_G00076350 [Pangasianodon hypophthalmus]|uniref:Uncharacterized protein n=1 Tax=Pangasianodon hypophthalmus TaxID=310915 RepID=A0A5N5LKQ6_PANHP|nr:hypothetical protein PHYPO_G00076350 [Pangasianodon hypophthalmus]
MSVVNSWENLCSAALRVSWLQSEEDLWMFFLGGASLLSPGGTEIRFELSGVDEDNDVSAEGFTEASSSHVGRKHSGILQHDCGRPLGIMGHTGQVMKL